MKGWRIFNIALSLEGQTSQIAKAEINSNEGFFMSLPSEVVVEILSRLAAIDVIKSKLVCRNWLKLLSTDEFVKLHLSRSNPCLVALERNVELEHYFCRIFNFRDPHNLDYDLIIRFHLSVFPLRPYDLVGSINGLICFSDFLKFLYVCNPVTSEYVILGDIEKDRDFVSYGFGVSNISGQYKVVGISYNLVYDVAIGIKDLECCVYTLGTGSWRTVGDPGVMYDYHCSDYNSGLFFNGNLHWVIKDFEGPELISCFDLEEESFQPFPPPPEVPREDLDSLGLGVVRGCLCLCDNTFESDIVVWVMKEYGVKKSWTKDFVINKVPCFSTAVMHGKFNLLKISKDADILLSTDLEGLLLLYRSEGKTLEVAGHGIRAMLGVSSFISLKDFEREEVFMFKENQELSNSEVLGLALALHIP